MISKKPCKSWTRTTMARSTSGNSPAAWWTWPRPCTITRRAEAAGEAEAEEMTTSNLSGVWCYLQCLWHRRAFIYIPVRQRMHRRALCVRYSDVCKRKVCVCYVLFMCLSEYFLRIKESQEMSSSGSIIFLLFYATLTNVSPKLLS